MKSIKFIALLLLVALMTSCAGLGSGVKDDDVLAVIEMMNAGQTEALVESSVLPFVFDGEILESETQINLLWSGLNKAGYVLDNPLILQQRPVMAEDASIFSETWEIKTYFKNLLTENDTYVEVQGAAGKLHMVLRPSKTGVQIAAWKGVNE
ncbi:MULTISPECIES: hypothetical protein [unclassified Oceanispirochaeta]|uniref:hypothetical protein n=1 Tax=unclassified Oceanispirochaeta TaxID=2635722 RepID=UPI000E08EB94|nr:MULTISPECIES: hypothetical protein [unclassified Oceanispirochaeta]MBF9017310.1 hypothetical protein [Oceanispirochaeta sp. M2]NPD73820.1 hypothetical protein [Oceanispirochaeta sp. M1]RDG30420.1 hypothetical protein DV872_17125 [Oceanispirochaeta sp. M1]